MRLKMAPNRFKSNQIGSADGTTIQDQRQSCCFALWTRTTMSGPHLLPDNVVDPLRWRERVLRHCCLVTKSWIPPHPKAPFRQRQVQHRDVGGDVFGPFELSCAVHRNYIHQVPPRSYGCGGRVGSKVFRRSRNWKLDPSPADR